MGDLLRVSIASREQRSSPVGRYTALPLICGCIFLTAGIFSYSNADAQGFVIADPPPNANTLGQLGGQNNAQSSMAGAIDAVCPTLVANGGVLNSAQADLRDVCRRMVQTANEVRGTGPTTFSYGLTEAGTNNVLQGINGEEASAPRDILTEAQQGLTQGVQSRLVALRTVGSTLSVSLPGFDNGDPIQTAYAVRNGRASGAASGQDSNLVSNWGAFLNGSFNWGDTDSSNNVDGFEFDQWSITAGVDYRIRDNLVAGIAVAYSDYEADFDSTANSASGQSVDAGNYSVSLYGTYYVGERFYVDGIATFRQSDYDSERRIVIVSNTAQPSENRTARADFDGHQFDFTVSGGYGFPINGATITPYGRISYLTAEIDDYSETGANGLNLAYDEQDIDSLTTNLGIQVSSAISTEMGVFVPTAYGEWVHEFENDGDDIRVQYDSDPADLSRFNVVLDSPDRDYFLVGAGVAVTTPGGWSPFVNLEGVFGLEDVSSYTVNTGVRKEF